MTQRTKTETETEVKEKEVTEYQCKNCEQWYESDGVIPFYADNGKYETNDFKINVCEHCADNLFDYKAETTTRAHIMRSMKNINSLELAFEMGKTITPPVAVLLFVVSLTVKITEMIATNATAEIYSVVGSTLPLIFVFMSIIAIIKVIMES